jgi:hypothetical protein
MTRTALSGLSLGLLSGVALIATGLTFGDPAFAQQRSSGGGHDSGGGHEMTDHGSGDRGGSGAGRGEGRGQGGQSVRDVFQELEDSERGSRGGTEDAARGQRGGDDTARGGRPADTGGRGTPGEHETTVDEDSDRPEWAGGGRGQPRGDSGGQMGDLFGDMVAILRDENGVPIMTQLPNGDWVVQPIDADGNVIPLDEEGHPVDETLTVGVEIGRLNVGRSPIHVLDRRLDEAVKNINDADSISLDASGRLVLTVDGEEKTIDSPLENLALYVTLMNTGTIPGVTDTSKFPEDLAHLVDGTLTMDDVLAAASFLAGATDKTVPISVDKVAYINLILGLEGNLTDQLGNEYVDFTDFSYDRESIYGDTTAEVLILQGGVYVPTIVNIYEMVFSGENYVDDGGIDSFTQAADDARAVLLYIHDNAAPETAAAAQ